MSERTLLVNGRIHTPGDPGATAILVENGLIGWVGHEGAALAHRDGVDRLIDLDGALVTPAFVDAHVHTTATGLALVGLDLSSCRSSADLVDALRTHCLDLAPGQVVFGHGWDDTDWPQQDLPSPTEIAEACGGAVAHLTRVDMHSGLASSAALDLVPGVRELPGFSRTWLRTAAHHEVRAAALEQISAGQRARLHRAALSAWAAQGVVAVHEMGGPGISSAEDFAQLIDRCAEPGSGPEVFGYWAELCGASRARRLGATGAGGDLFADGTIGSHTACLSRAYSDGGPNGPLNLDPAAVQEHVLDCEAIGMPAGFHAIGDAAISSVLSGFSAATEAIGALRIRTGRHRIEHAEMAGADQRRTMVDLGITASMQPLFDQLWGGPDGMYAERLGRERAATMNQFSALASDGVALAFGSDAPVTMGSPWESIRAAVMPHEPSRGLAARAAFNAHTRGGWRVVGHDDAGVIRPGARAALAAWRCDELVVQEPDERVSGWSTDPRSGTPPLPRLAPDVPLPQCLLSMRDGVVIHDVGLTR